MTNDDETRRDEEAIAAMQIVPIDNAVAQKRLLARVWIEKRFPILLAKLAAAEAEAKRLQRLVEIGASLAQSVHERDRT